MDSDQHGRNPLDRANPWIGNCFAAVGDNSTILTSPDGITWTKAALKKSDQHLYGIASNANITVVVGLNGTLLTSTDFVHWMDYATGLSERIYSALWTGTQFILLGDAGLMLTSSDGVTWSIFKNYNGQHFHRAIWTGSSIVGTTYYGIQYSSNLGASWLQRLSTTNRLLDVAGNSTTMVAVGQVSNTVYVSSDYGVSWSPQSVPAPVPSLSGIAWTGTQFIAVGNGEEIYASADGKTWSVDRVGYPVWLSQIAAHGDTLLVATDMGDILINKKVEIAATPTITFAPGPPGSQPQIIFVDETAGAKIYYTDDGSEPTPTSKLYTTPFSPAQSCVIKARAYKDGATPSDIAAGELAIGMTNAAPNGVK